MFISVYGRAPLINYWRIKQLRIFIRETQKMIDKMKHGGSAYSREIFYERQLLLILKHILREETKYALNSEFFSQDYFSSY